MKRPDDPVIDFLLRLDMENWSWMTTIKLIMIRCAELEAGRPLTRHIAEWRSELSNTESLYDNQGI